MAAFNTDCSLRKHVCMTVVSDPSSVQPQNCVVLYNSSEWWLLENSALGTQKILPQWNHD